MIVLGLTGSIGMGKTTTAAMFAARGVLVWDADAVVGRLYGPGGPAGAALDSLFPGASAPDGSVDRAHLRNLIAKDPSVLDCINAIVHPLVAQDRAEFLADANGLVVLDIPLLFETGMQNQCDRVAVVSTDAETQRARVLERGTMSVDEFDAILSRQVPDAEKRAQADYIIDTSSMDDAQDAVDRIIEDLT